MRTSIQVSTQHQNDALKEENPIQTGPSGPPILKTVASIWNFTFAKATVVSPQYQHFSV